VEMIHCGVTKIMQIARPRGNDGRYRRESVFDSGRTDKV
jgi:hypothetical protein